MSDVLVTGGAGFIGSHLVAALLRRGDRVVVLDDLSTGKLDNLEAVRRELPESGERLRVVEGSLLDPDALHSAVQGARIVLHQAAIPSVPRSFADPAGTLRANVEGTARLLEAARSAGVERLVFVSSSSIYGDNPTLPKHEGLAPEPRSPYAVSKHAGEELLQVFASEYGIGCAALRYFNVFGPRQDPDSQYSAVIPKFISRMLDGKQPVVYGDGEQSRDFTYVDNVAMANLLAAGLEKPDATPENPTPLPDDEAVVLNVGAGTRFTLLQLVDAINDILGTAIEPRFEDPRPGDVRHSHAAIDAVRGIGYEPGVGFLEGVRRTVRWFEDGGVQPLQPPLQQSSSAGS